MTAHTFQTPSPQRALMTLAWPAIIENLSVTLIIFIDSAMVGSLGAIATAAVGVNASPGWLMNGLVMALGVGGTALVARMVGANDRDGIAAITRHTMLYAFGISVLLMLFALLGAPLIPRLMGADPAVHPDAIIYQRLVGLAYIPHFCGMAASALLRGAGDTKSPMRAALMANSLNVIGNFLLIFPTRQLSVLGLRFTMPGAGLGVRGAAIATALATGIAGLYVLSLLFSRKGDLGLRRGPGFRPQRAVFARIWYIAAPAAMERVSISLGQIVFAGMVARLGVSALAAHHLSISIESMGYMPGYGFAVAAATLVGQRLGAAQPLEARSLGFRAIGTGVLTMSAIGIVMFIYADALIAFLTPDPAVRLIGAGLLRICAFEQPFSALSIIAPSALRGAGDTRAPFYISFFSMWGVRLVFAYVLGTVFKLGVQGIWLAMVLDLGVRGFLLLYRFHLGAWQYARV